MDSLQYKREETIGVYNKVAAIFNPGTLQTRGPHNDGDSIIKMHPHTYLTMPLLFWSLNNHCFDWLLT